MAEEIFRVLAWSVRDRAAHEARSAGTEPDGDGRALAARDLEWADVVCVMESEHGAHIRERWPLHGSKVRVLGIPDDYEPGDPVLRDRLTTHILSLLSEARSAPVPSRPRAS